MSEAWLPIVGFPGYEVSDHGRLRSSRGRTPRILRPRKHRHGYQTVCLRKDGRSFEHLVHRLVAVAFVIGSGTWVNHLNGAKSDNRACNLEWASPSENAFHAYRTGLQPSRAGAGNGKAKLTDAIVLQMRTQRSRGMLIREIAALHGVSRSTVTNIVNRNAWTHV